MRKIIQIAFEAKGETESTDYGPRFNVESQIHALCDDGTVWFLEGNWASGSEKWVQWLLPEIPQE